MKSAFSFILLLVAFAAISQEVKTYRSTEVDVKPNLEEGMYTLTMFISDNFKFPDIKNKKVRIFTSFVIEPDGSMVEEKAFYIDVREYLPTDVVRIQTEEEKAREAAAVSAMKAEAARVLALFDKKWTPAMVAGKPVRCLYNYPISFNIE